MSRLSRRCGLLAAMLVALAGLMWIDVQVLGTTALGADRSSRDATADNPEIERADKRGGLASSDADSHPGRLEAILDSLRTQSDTLSFRWNELATPLGWTHPDSGLWIPSAATAPSKRLDWRRIRFSTSPAVGFSKVEGLTSGASIGVSWLRGPGLLIQGRVDRAYGRGVYQGDVTVAVTDRPRASIGFPKALRTRITGGGKESTGGGFDAFDRPSIWSVRTGYSRRALPFGSNRPFVNALQASLLGLDHQSYLDREERFAGVEVRPFPSAVAEAWVVDRRDRSIASSLDPLFQTDPRAWRNPHVDEGSSRGAIVRAGWTDHEFGRPMRGAGVQGSAFGGLFGDDREYYTAGAELHTSRTAPHLESIELELAAAAAGGDVPVQSLPDLGGSSNLRGYPPRARVGATSVFARLDLVSAVDPLRRARIPLLRSLRLQPVLFADLGAVWGGSGWSSVRAMTLPEAVDWRSDFGIGIQRSINYPGLLSRIRVDLAWRTDRAHDRMRASLTLTR